MLQKLKIDLEKAISTRESGNLEKSRKLFEILLHKTEPQLKLENSKKNNYFYATLMGEYVIQYRLEASNLYSEALSLGRDLLKYDKENNIGNPLSIRSIANVLLNMGAFEMAEDYLRQMISFYPDNSAKRGDTKAHLAYTLFRIGRIEEASDLVEEAMIDIRRNDKEEKFVDVWLSHSLMVKSLILNSKNKYTEALKYAKKAVSFAKRSKSVFRIKQSEELLSFISSKIKAL